MSIDAKIRHQTYLRGVVLKLVYDGRANQESRMDDLMLWALMVGLRMDVGQNDVLTLLQDLCERGYLRFHSQKNRITNRTEISQIEITAQGSNVAERIVEDPAVLIP